jgi:septum formation protein
MGKHLPVRLILASGSSGRRELLTKAGYTFDVMPANIDEPTEAGSHTARSFVHTVAWSKAAAVAPKVTEGLVLAADTVGWVDGKVVGKPADVDDARRMLRRMSGTIHELWTGVVVWRRPDNLQLTWQELSQVAFRPMSDGEIEEYLQTRQWQGCSGGYSIQERDDPHLTIIEGSWSNVVGLPMETLERVLPLMFQAG